MSHMYDLVISGKPSSSQVAELEQAVLGIIDKLGLKLGREVSWQVCPEVFEPVNTKAAAIVYFAAGNEYEAWLTECLASGIPVLPIVSSLKNVSDEVPETLRHINALPYNESGVERVATALLECVNLLPSQRKVFLSYRRDESREAALQLFDVLSARLFDVFLDTHGIAPAKDFQTHLWHRLCDSDVFIMLDTANYFDSRWTRAEFGRAQAKDIGILRVGWPGVEVSPRAQTAESVLLAHEDIIGQRLSEKALETICNKVELLRSKTYAIRSRNLITTLRDSLQKVGGEVFGASADNGVYLRLPDGNKMVVYPFTGVPTSMTLHRAVSHATACKVKSSAVIYDHVGLHAEWLQHMEWLSGHVKSTTHWLKASEVAWQLADWQVQV